MTPALIARALGGEVVRGAVLAPGPGHSKLDRSLSVKLSANSPDGVLVHSFAGDNWMVCRDHVADRLGINRVRREHRPSAKLESRAAKQGPSEQDRIARAVAIWDEGRDPRGTIVERYLTGRGLDLPDDAGAVLRFHPRCPWRDQDRDETVFVPAMVAAMRSITTDEVRAIHRTRLTEDGRKVDRRMLGLAGGCAIKVDPDDGVTLGLTIGEGIETVLAARQLGFWPAWALASAGAIAALPVLAGVEALTLLAEADQASERAIASCGERWAVAGRQVLIVEPRVGSDLNDSLRGAA